MGAEGLGGLGKMLRREGADIKFSAMFYWAVFYRAVVQAVLLFGSESWVLSAAMEKTVEGVHTGFLRRIMGKRAQRITGGMWVTPAAGEVWEAMGTQLAATYIGHRQGTVAQWVALHPIFKFCAR